jgi:hypothetical protein
LPLTRLQAIDTGAASRTVTLTGDGVKAVSCFVEYDGVAGLTHHGLWDATAGAWRAHAEVTWASDGSATCAALVGTLLAFDALDITGVAPTYRIVMQSTSCTAVSTHGVYASDAGATTATSIRVGGVQVENATYPSSRIATAASAVTRAADRCEFPFYAHPQAMTVYAHFIERAQPNWVNLGAAPRIAQVGSAASGTPALQLTKPAAGDTYLINHHNGTTNVTSSADVNPAFDNRIELRSILNADGSVQIGVAKDGAAESLGTASAANTLAAAWSSPTLVSLGCIGANGQGDIALRSLIIAAGVQTLATMQGL